MKRQVVMFLLLASVLGQNVALVAGQMNMTLYAVADNYADSKYPRSAYGHVSALYVGNSYDHAQYIWGSERIYIQFNLTEIPKGRVILQATLRLWQYYAPASEQTYEAHRVLQDWNESAQNWLNQPSWVSAKTSDTVAPARTEVAVEWNITSDVKAWYSGEARNYGTMIKVAKEDNLRDASSGFWSREYPVGEWKPRLIVVVRGDPAFTFAVKVSVEGLPQGMTSTVFVDGQAFTSISPGGEVELAFDRGTTQAITVTQLLSNSTGTRYRCEDSGIRVSGETSHVFAYATEYLVTFSTEPRDLFQTPESGWYRSGVVLVANRTGADVVGVNSTVRLVFDGWRAGSYRIGETSEASTGRTLKLAAIVVNGTFTVEGRYRTEYLLNVSSPFGRTQGSGWYPRDSTASFSVDSNTVPVEGFLGLVGLRHSFTRWIGSENLIGSPLDTQASIVMNGPKDVEAVWQDDWNSLLVNAAVLVVLVLIAAAIVIGSAEKESPSARSATAKVTAGFHAFMLTRGDKLDLDRVASITAPVQ